VYDDVPGYLNQYLVTLGMYSRYEKLTMYTYNYDKQKHPTLMIGYSKF